MAGRTEGLHFSPTINSTARPPMQESKLTNARIEAINQSQKVSVQMAYQNILTW
jgi:hypothetical protein